VKFFERPAVGTVRKRFAWWPVKRTLIRFKYIPDPTQNLIPFEPGWHEALHLPTGFTTGGRPKPIPTAAEKMRMGGYVRPCQYGAVTTDDGWRWLEWVVDKLEMESDQKSKWRPMELPKQWSLFHEYN
jgi:hypothetical protein